MMKKKSTKYLSNEPSKKVCWKIHCLNFSRLTKISDWCWKRYAKKSGFVDFPPIAKYITTHHYHYEEYKAGML